MWKGCPSTLGVNHIQTEIVEKITENRRLKPRIFGTGGSTIQGIEKDTRCRLKLEDNLTAGNGSFFVRIFGSNRVMVGKAVDAVKRLLDHVQDDRKPQNARKSHGSHNRSSDSLAGSHMQHIASQQTQYEPNMQPYAKQEASYYDEQHNSMDQLGARRQWETGSQNGAFAMAYSLKGGPQYDERPLSKGVSKEDDHGQNGDAGFDQQGMPPTLETLEQKFVQETMQLTKALNDARLSERFKNNINKRSSVPTISVSGRLEYYNYEDEGQGQPEQKRGKFEVDVLNAGEEMDGYGEEAEDDDKWATEVAIAKEEMDQ
ncbi:hypothetical protein GOP47_0016911 [Adiantum capillus-veneris]|uniref:K Homology domain-containing protein n=1 Tax=Adiantum capillus-veneris TaxID=13818 RepID=A0A9D4UJI8_ADICA|nr:hypothetical protein GOP47_0016911 [Adiantum capillus-veneris]